MQKQKYFSGTIILLILLFGSSVGFSWGYDGSDAYVSGFGFYDSKLEELLLKRSGVKKVFQIESIPPTTDDEETLLVLYGDRTSSKDHAITFSLFKKRYDSSTFPETVSYQETEIAQYSGVGDFGAIEFQVGNFSGDFQEDVLLTHHYVGAGNHGGVAIDRLYLIALNAPYPQLLQLDTRYFDWYELRENELTMTFEFDDKNAFGIYETVKTRQLFEVTTDDSAYYYKYGIPDSPIYTKTDGIYQKRPSSSLFSVDQTEYDYTIGKGEKVFIRYECPEAALRNTSTVSKYDHAYHCADQDYPELQSVVLLRKGIPVQTAPATFSENTTLTGFRLLVSPAQKKFVFFKTFHDEEKGTYLWDMANNQLYFYIKEQTTGKIRSSENLQEHSQEIIYIKSVLDQEIETNYEPR